MKNTHTEISDLLFGIPITLWVQGTGERMRATGKQDSKTWSNYWFDVYESLGGTSYSSGSKGCPKYAAYGLWRLGRIANSKNEFQNWSLEIVNIELGKNAAYAILALELLHEEASKENTKPHWSKAELWARVQDAYWERIKERPARSEQGAIKIALGLLNQGQIIIEPD